MALDAAMSADARFAASMGSIGIRIPRSPSGTIRGISIENWVWHHHTKPRVMQLVLKSQHPVIPAGIFWITMHPGSKVGISIWGKK
jgi:hypothetical protein